MLGGRLDVAPVARAPADERVDGDGPPVVRNVDDVVVDRGDGCDHELQPGVAQRPGAAESRRQPAGHRTRRVAELAASGDQVVDGDEPSPLGPGVPVIAAEPDRCVLDATDRSHAGVPRRTDDRRKAFVGEVSRPCEHRLTVR
jgi:hypothetical protein